MADLSGIDTDELKSRRQYVLDELDRLVKQVGPLLKSFGNLREEGELIQIELEKREKKDV